MAAMKYGGDTHRPSDIFDGIRSRDFQLWPGEKSAALTEVIVYPRFKACRVFLAGGDLEELKHTEKRIAAWAAAIGCTRMEICGRRGWLRALDGYEDMATFMTRTL